MSADDRGNGAPPPVKPLPGLGLIALPGGQASTIRKYDEAEFLVGGRLKGQRGELERAQFKIHEGYMAEVSKWIKSGAFPYETDSDLFRHAVVRHVRYFLPALEGEVEGSLLHELKQIDDMVARWKFQNDFMKHIESIADEVTRTLQMPGGKREVARMLKEIKQRIDQTRETYFKGVYQKMFMDRFSAYLPEAPGLKLVKFRDGDEAGEES